MNQDLVIMLTSRPERGFPMVEDALAHGATGPSDEVPIVAKPTASGTLEAPGVGLSLQTTPTLPKISCLTATLDRLILLKEAIRCYLDQTYPNKELVIVTEGTPRYKQAIAAYLQTLGRDDIKLVTLDGDDYTLGKVRNVSLEAATGDVVCQWDDDDLYHPHRLAVQAGFMLQAGAEACFLTDQLQYFVEERELFWIDWTLGGQVQGQYSQIPGTLMMYADARFRYPDDARKHEDSALQEAITGTLQIVGLPDQGHLYVYRYHTRNSFSKEHHKKLTTYATSAEFIEQRREPLLAALPYYRLPMPYTVKAHGEQEVFSYNG